MKMLILAFMALFIVACGDDAYAPPAEEEFPVLNLRIANFHGAYDKLHIKTDDGTWYPIEMGAINIVPVLADGYLTIRSNYALYNIETPVLFSTDVVIIRETNTEDRITLDIVTRDNKGEMCELYAGFKDAYLYARMCPNIDPYAHGGKR